MIQKMMILFAAIFMLHGVAKAEDSKLIQFEQLPVAAQTFVKANFENVSISYVMQDEEGLFGKEYDVIFTDGNKIGFDRKGNWKQINFKTGFIPAKMIPAQIQSFLEEKHSGKKVVELERDSKEYEVKFSDGVELHFNKQFKLIGYDH
ncbi:MAG: PepSY-like domain-containing protein [Bacteroidales bacterium]